MARDVLSSVTSTDHQGIKDLHLLQVRLSEMLIEKKLLPVLGDVVETLSYSELEKLIDFLSHGTEEFNIIEDFPKVHFLIFDSYIPKQLTEVGTVISLRMISFSHCSGFTELPSSISNIKDLRYLNLSHSPIQQLSDSICTLYELETLSLFGCRYIVELPNNMGRLIKLRCLDVRGTKLKEMPVQMGKLRNLIILRAFAVGKHGGSNIRELGELHNLSELSILNLQNVQCARDAEKVNLKDKRKLSKLVLHWGDDTNNTENEINVIEQMCPPTNLKDLNIKYYGGKRFPIWLGDCSFSDMVSIHLSNCKYCCSLPPLGQLPALKELSIAGFRKVSRVDREFYGNDSLAIKPFKSLKKLTFMEMPEWQEWSLFVGEDGAGVFSTLQELSIFKCPKLRNGLPNHLPSLIKLEIEKCQHLVASIHRVPSLRVLCLRDCDNVLLKELPSQLCDLTIASQSFVELIMSLPGVGSHQTLKSIESHGILQLPGGHYHPSIKKLVIRGDSDSPWSLPLELFPELSILETYGCENFEFFSISKGSHPVLTFLICMRILDCPKFESFPSGGLCAPNLKEIEISNCEKLNSLPEGMHSLLPSLVTLRLFSCPKLKSFPKGGLPSNLETLEIFLCDKLFSHRMEWGLQGVCSLRAFKIGSRCEEVQTFPEEALLPHSLTTLSISFFPYMKSLNNKGFRHLTSLKCLKIEHCPRLECLPKEGLPTSLSFLHINRCPLIEQQCQGGKGKEWPKIAHIAHIEINFEVQGLKKEDF